MMRLPDKSDLSVYGPCSQDETIILIKSPQETPPLAVSDIEAFEVGAAGQRCVLPSSGF